MKKYIGYWLRRARKKRGFLQEEVAKDKFARHYISMIETGDANLTDNLREHITKILKLPGLYFDDGLFTYEKEELEKLKKETDILLDSEKHEEAKSLVLKALSISQEAKSDDYTNNFSVKLARILVNEKKLKEAEEIFEKTNKYYSEEKDYKNLAYSYYWTGVLYREKKNYTDAVFMFNSAIEVNSKLKRKKDLSLNARALTKIAQIYEYTENYKGAKIKIKEALKLAEKLKDDFILAIVYWEYSLLLQREGEYDKAINYYNKASSIYKNLGYEKDTLRISNNLASIYYYKKDYDKVIQLTERTIKISKEKKYMEELAYALINGAKAKRYKGLLDEAESEINESITLFDKLEDDRMLGISYIALALLQEKKKRKDLTILNFNKAIDIFKDLDKPVYILSAYGEIIRFYDEIGNFKEEREEYINKLIDKTKRVIF